MPLSAIFIGLIAGVGSLFSGASENSIASTALTGPLLPLPVKEVQKNILRGEMSVPRVPFFSQFADISDPDWQKLGCGIADLAMLIEFYKPGSVSVDTLLTEGIAAGAFLQGAGWKHKDLAALAEQHGLFGTTHDFSHLDKETAFARFEDIIAEGPVIASIYYGFNTKSPIPHLAVINEVANGRVYFNDPARGTGGESVSIEEFKNGWKKRLIVIRPFH